MQIYGNMMDFMITFVKFNQIRISSLIFISILIHIIMDPSECIDYVQ